MASIVLEIELDTDDEKEAEWAREHLVTILESIFALGQAQVVIGSTVQYGEHLFGPMHRVRTGERQ